MNSESALSSSQEVFNTNYAHSVRLIKDNIIDDGNLIDFDGNVYNIVTIGGQIWTKQNLATKHYRDGSIIGTVFDDIEGMAVAYNNDEANVYNYA